jgi:hypothetical protein
MKLSKENIQSIDNYLKHEQVVYFDIRMEMVDHIANAVEEKMEVENLNFYDAFKSYMILNKKEIMKQSKTDAWSLFSFKTITKFVLYLLKPLNVLLAIMFFLFFKFVSINSFFSDSFTFSNLLFVIIILLALFQIFYFHFYLKERFYYIEKIGGVFAIIYYLHLFLAPTLKTSTSVYTYTFFSFLLTGYVLYFIKSIVMFNSFKKNYLYEN